MNVSFVVIAHKSSGTLELCLKSVELVATTQDELILVLNHPDEATKAIALTHPLWKIIDEKKPGPASARNAGATIASRELICFLDSDIGLNQGWHQAALENFRDPWIVAGQFKIKPDNDGSLLTILKRFHYLNFNVRYFRTRYNSLPILDTANLVIKKEWFNNLKGFDTDLRYLEDTEFSLRLLREGADLFFDSSHCVTEFIDSEESLFSYITKQFERCKYLPKVMAIHSLDFYFPSPFKLPREIPPPGIFLKLANIVVKCVQYAGIACTPYPIYLNHNKAGRIARNQKKFVMTGMNPTVRSIWVNKKEKYYDILLKEWKTKPQL